MREDLFYRLHVVPLRIPPLRERADDVVFLAEHFLRFCRTGRAGGQYFHRRCPSRVQALSQPGNVRQLENIIHRLVLMSDGDSIGYDDLRQAISDSDVVDGTNAPTRNTAFGAQDAKPVQVEPLWLTEKNYSGGN